MAKKTDTKEPAPPAEITEDAITAKVKESLGGLTRAQAKTILENQRDHDAAL